MNEEKLEILRDKFLKYHLEYKDEEILFEIIDKLQKENTELNKLTNNLREENIELIAYKNKLINYIAIRENKTHEEVEKEFEIGE